MKRNEIVFGLVALGLLAVMLATFVLVGGPPAPVVAGPLAAPTPLVTGYNQGSTRYPVNFFSTQTITADVGSTLFVLPNYETLDIMYVIGAANYNTTTLKLQHSNDGSNWTDGLTVASAVGAVGGTSLNQFTNFGIYTRIYADVTNATPVAITAIGVAK